MSWCIVWANIHLDLCSHMASLGHNGFDLRTIHLKMSFLVNNCVHVLYHVSTLWWDLPYWGWPHQSENVVCKHTFGYFTIAQLCDVIWQFMILSNYSTDWTWKMIGVSFCVHHYPRFMSFSSQIALCGLYFTQESMWPTCQADNSPVRWCRAIYPNGGVAGLSLCAAITLSLNMELDWFRKSLQTYYMSGVPFM